MATSFDTIYGMFENRGTDTPLGSLSDNLYYYSMYLSLKYAIAEFSSSSVVDLTERTDFSQEIYQFTGDGVETEYTLSPAPPTSGIFYVSVNDVEISSDDYSFDSVTNILTFDNAPALDAAIYIGVYIIGTFTNTLSDTEQSILVDGMIINLVDKNLFTTKQLSQWIYGNSLGLHSQANHNKINMNLRDLQHKRWEQRIINYSYNYDSDDLEGLVGEA